MSKSLDFQYLTLHMDNVMLEIERQKRRQKLFTIQGDEYEASVARTRIAELQERVERIAAKIEAL